MPRSKAVLLQPCVRAWRFWVLPSGPLARMAEGVDWQGLMRLGYGALRLSPDTFWTMTPAEFRLALEGAGLLPIGADLPMDRARLHRLMSAYPDGGAELSAKSEE